MLRFISSGVEESKLASLGGGFGGSLLGIKSGEE
jgi:hypothetical protein